MGFTSIIFADNVIYLAADLANGIESGPVTGILNNYGNGFYILEQEEMTSFYKKSFASMLSVKIIFKKAIRFITSDPSRLW